MILIGTKSVKTIKLTNDRTKAIIVCKSGHLSAILFVKIRLYLNLMAFLFSSSSSTKNVTKELYSWKY